MTAAVNAVTEAEGAVGVLINNAGYSQSGAVETVPLDQVRRQFETNVFGLMRHVPAGAAGDARPALGQDRQHQLDGRQADVPRRRALPRDQVRGRGDQRRAALRGARLRRRRDPDRAGADRHELRRGRDGDGARRGRRAVRRTSTSKVGEADDRSAYKGPMAKLGGPARDGRQDDRRRAEGKAPEGPLPGHRERAPDDQPAAADARPRCGT